MKLIIITILTIVLTALASCDNLHHTKSIVDAPKEWGRCQDLHFISSRNGFAVISNQDGKYVIWRTDNGGVSWNEVSQPTHDCCASGCKFEIQSYENIVYITVCSIETNESTIYSSNDLGKTWSNIAEFDFRVDATHVFDKGKMAIVNKNYGDVDFMRVMTSVTNGAQWREIISRIPLNSSFFIDKSFYYYSDMSIRFPMLPQYNIVELNLEDGATRVLNGKVTGAAPLASNGLLVTGVGTLNFFNINDNSITNLSKLKRWGVLFKGGYRSQFICRHDDELFLISSQYPGSKNLVESISYSNDAGHSWNQLELIPNNRKRVAAATYFVENNILHLVTLDYDNKLIFYSISGI